VFSPFCVDYSLMQLKVNMSSLASVIEITFAS